MMNVFWTRLEIRKSDVVFTQASKSLCELGDPSEFIAYGEARCRHLGLEDDTDVANFLSQAFDGDVRLWYDSLHEDVQSSWFLLKNSLLEEFGNGEVLESMHLLTQVWWQVPDYEECLDTLWKVYEQVSFFQKSFLHVLKKKMLDKYREACVQLQELHESEVLDEALSGCLHEDDIDMGSNLKDVMASQESDRFSFGSSLHDDSEAMDDLSSDEATSIFDEESVYESLTDQSDEVASMSDEEGKHVLLEDKASFERGMEKCVDLVADVMDPMHEDDSMEDTRGVGKIQDFLDADLQDEQVVESKDCNIENMCDEDMKIEDTHVGVPELDAGKEEDLWDVASFDEEEPMVDMDAGMKACVAKATLRIKETLEERDAKSLKAYGTVQVSNLVEESLHGHTHSVLRDLDNTERNVSHMLLGEAHQGEADLEVFSKELAIVMLFCAAIDHVMQKCLSLSEDKNCGVFYLQTMEAQWDMGGDSAPIFDSDLYDKRCMPGFWSGCMHVFYFDPGGWVGKMLVVFWSTSTWPFDPGGS